MTTIEAFDILADNTPESKKTVANDVLFFHSDMSVGEVLKKLKNHKFKIGYTYEIDINGTQFTRLYAYNSKGDIYRGWFESKEIDGKTILKLPEDTYGFKSLLTAARYAKVDGQEVLKLFREDCYKSYVKNFREYGRFSNLQHLTDFDDIEYYGMYFPILENPEIESYRRNCLENMDSNLDCSFYSDVATACNIYKFDETYEYLDDGLKSIYKFLYDNREERFCLEVKSLSLNWGLVNEILQVLNLDYSDLIEMFERNNIETPKSIKSMVDEKTLKRNVFEKTREIFLDNYGHRMNLGFPKIKKILTK